MSEQNVELSRHLIEAFNRRDIEAMLAYFDDALKDLGVSEEALEPIAP